MPDTDALICANPACGQPVDPLFAVYSTDRAGHQRPFCSVECHHERWLRLLLDRRDAITLQHRHRTIAEAAFAQRDRERAAEAVGQRRGPGADEPPG